jgi:DNA-binding PadR family transcriptional regulator
MRTYLGEFEQLLLMAVIQLDGDAYGGQIRETIGRRTGRTVSPGAIYTALDRLEARGLVTSRLGDPEPRRGGKRKRYYRIEPAGSELLRRSHEALARMARGLTPRLEPR